MLQKEVTHCLCADNSYRRTRTHQHLSFIILIVCRVRYFSSLALVTWEEYTLGSNILITLFIEK